MYVCFIVGFKDNWNVFLLMYKKGLSLKSSDKMARWFFRISTQIYWWRFRCFKINGTAFFAMCFERKINFSTLLKKLFLRQVLFCQRWFSLFFLFVIEIRWYYWRRLFYHLRCLFHQAYLLTSPLFKVTLKLEQVELHSAMGFISMSEEPVTWAIQELEYWPEGYKS